MSDNINKAGKVNNVRARTLFITQFAALLAIEAIISLIPTLGSIPIGPVVATLSAIPVIITAIVLGPKAGAVMGFAFGVFSFIWHSFMSPGAFSFIFTPITPVDEYSGNILSLVICFVPRILIGVVAGCTNRYFPRRSEGNAPVRYAVSALLGSATNTALVLGGIALFFGDKYETLLEKALGLLIGTIVLTNGIPEMIAAVVITIAVCIPLQKITRVKTY